MNTVTTCYEGCVLMQRTSGGGPYFGHYRFVRDGRDAEAVAWIDLTKSWSTEQLACDDAVRAAHFAIDAQNYGNAVGRSVEAAAQVMMLDSKAPGWPEAVKAQFLAANERDGLEARLIGAKERHWPEIQRHTDRSEPIRWR